TDHHLAFVAEYRHEQRGDIAGTAGKIQHAVTATHATGGHEMPLPQAMRAERHQVVHQVVVARDRGEHLADQLLLVADRHVAKAEMRGGFRRGFRLLVHPRNATARRYSVALPPSL